MQRNETLYLWSKGCATLSTTKHMAFVLPYPHHCCPGELSTINMYFSTHHFLLSIRGVTPGIFFFFFNWHVNESYVASPAPFLGSVTHRTKHSWMSLLSKCQFHSGINLVNSDESSSLTGTAKTWLGHVNILSFCLNIQDLDFLWKGLATREQLHFVLALVLIINWNINLIKPHSKKKKKKRERQVK